MMTDEKREEIKRLAEIAFAKQAHYDALSMMAISFDPIVKKQQYIDYAIAQAELYEANQALDAAQKGKAL